MKIRCDVCDKENASVFCTSDEASLCAACDHRVHHANKLASKHLRYSLIYSTSSSKQSPPLCDVCQEKIAFLFCQQDRAILCKDCDTPIHTANEHAKKHNRFLLTGVRLSVTSSQYESTSITSSSSSRSLDPLIGSHDFSVPGSSIPLPPTSEKPTSLSFSKSHGEKPPAAMNKVIDGDDAVVVNPLGYTSTISEYLIDVLPGWHVEDFLDSSLAAPFGVSKNGDGELPSMDTEENLGIWVPQIPQNQSSSFPNQYPSYCYNHSSNNNGNTETVTGIFKEVGQNKNKRDFDDGGFTVPQIPITPLLHQSSPSTKKSRSLW